MTVKGTLIATLAAGYLASAAPAVVHAEEKAPAKGEKAGCKGEKGEKKKGDKAGCKGAGGCKGHEGEKKEEKKAEEKK
jgi:hypothetical protein